MGGQDQMLLQSGCFARRLIAQSRAPWFRSQQGQGVAATGFGIDVLGVPSWSLKSGHEDSEADANHSGCNGEPTQQRKNFRTIFHLSVPSPVVVRYFPAMPILTPTEDLKRILVCRTDGLGDVILTLPIAAAIRGFDNS